jgi:hypothetical protein
MNIAPRAWRPLLALGDARTVEMLCRGPAKLAAVRVVSVLQAECLGAEMMASDVLYDLCQKLWARWRGGKCASEAI